MADEEDLRSTPHALLISFPTQGHVNPMLHLASRLLDLRFSTTLAISDAFSCSLCTPKSGIDLLTYSDPKISDGNILEFCFSDQSCIRDPVEKLLRLGGKREVSCIIFDSGSVSWVPDMAEILNIPCAMLYTFSAATTVLFNNFPMLVSDLAAADAKEQRNEIISRIPGLLPLGHFDIPQMVRLILENDPNLERMARHFKIFDKITWKLVNSFQELEPDALHSTNLVPIGPLLPLDGYNAANWELNASSLEEDFSCLEWLNKQAPASVLYVSFGSMGTMSAVQVEELVQAFKASNQLFLWAFRPDFITDVPDSYMQNLIESIGNQGMIVPWAPQLKVLGHEAVGGFLTHGGWNSIIESISMGVPMLCWPCRAEQHLNSKYIVDGWKIGVRVLKDGLIKKDEICELINILMEDEEGKEMKKRAMEFRNMAIRSCMVGGSSFENLVAIKDALLARSLHNNLKN